METVSIVETREELVARMAAKARRDGVRLYHDGRDGRYYASSASQPGKMHYVTGVSCDCLGFQTHQHCKHHAALIVALGWTDGTAPASEVEAMPETACPTCANTRIIHRQHSRWIGGGKLGYRSEWVSPEPCPDCTPDAAA